MPTYQQKTIVKSYKLKIKNKLKCLSEETEDVIIKLRSCVSTFHQRLEELVRSDDETFLSQYQKINTVFEKHQEKLFFLLASIDGTSTDDDNEVAISEESLFLSGDISSLNQESAQNSTVRDSSAVSKSQTSASSLYRSLQDYKSTDQTHLETDKEHNVVDYSLSEYPENRYNVSRVLKGEHLKVVERNVPDHSLDLQQSEKSTSQNSCYISPSSSCNQSSASLFESLASQNTEVKQLESNSPCSYPQLKPKVLIPPVVPLDTVISTTLTHINNPGDFWMQLKNSKGYEISFSISEFIRDNPPPCIDEGDYCLAPFKSSPYYYRAQALNEALGSEDVEVFFVDYGSNQKISLMNIRPLPRSAYEIPIQAFRCKLFNISPLNGVWTSESIEKLKEFQNNSIQTSVKYFDCGKFAVQLVATLSALFSEDFSCDIAHALCLNGLASLNMAPQSDQESTEISNQTSCDSGVSVTSNQRASPIVHRFSYSSDMIENSLPFNDQESLSVLLNKNGQHSQAVSNMRTNRSQDLISFESAEKMHDDAAGEMLASFKDENDFLRQRCRKTSSCDCSLHLTIPPPSVSFVEKDMMLVMVSNVISPSEFYVNLAMENSFNLDELQEQMSALYESQPDSFLIGADDLKEGMFCAGRFNMDGLWYRVVILEIHSTSENSCDVYVQYIDYGNKTLMKHDNLRPLLPKFADHPSFSIKCSLAGVTPKHRSGNSTSEAWSEGAVGQFQQLISFDRCLTAQICESRLGLSTPSGPVHYTQSRPIQVLLWDTKGTKDILINEALLETGLADIDTNFVNVMQLDNKILSKEKAVLNYWDPMDEEYNDVENSYGVHAEECEVAISGYKQNDESYTCKYFSLRGYCPRGDHCPYQHIDLDAGGATRDQEETFAIDLVPSLPNPSSHVLVQVSTVVSPSLFYSILLFGSKSVGEIDSLVLSGASSQSFVNYGDEIHCLFTAMNAHYGNSPFAENTAVALAFGSIVVAWRKADNAWHRARILNVSDIAGPSQVFFVDFGNAEWVPRKSIQEILPEYLYTPFQAIECHLSDVEPLGFEKGKNWSPQAVNRFKELVAAETLLAHITHRYDNILHVTLRKTTKENHVHISDLLVSEGFAQYQTVKASALKETRYIPG